MGLKLLLVTLATALLAYAQSLPSGPDKELVEAVCGACHTTERILDQHLSKAQWKSLVLEMLQENPEVTQPERDKIVEYLAKTFPPKAKVNKVSKIRGYDILGWH